MQILRTRARVLLKISTFFQRNVNLKIEAINS